MLSTAVLASRATAVPADPLSCARAIRNFAARALLEELVTYPKPGLVSLVDNGSHADMDARTFIRSTLSLRTYLLQAALAGHARSRFEALRLLGVAAEARMLKATAGVNTHRGAIFGLGLLAAAAGWHADARMPGRRFEPGLLGRSVAREWGRDIAAHVGDPESHGNRANQRHGTGGARAEAAGGFPSVYRIALPAYREVLGRGGSANQARVQAFFALLAAVEDTNLLHRGGARGLADARNLALHFLASGGVAQTGWHGQAVSIHRRFIETRSSPGGCADLLAACVFVHSLEA